MIMFEKYKKYEFYLKVNKPYVANMKLYFRKVTN